MSLTLRGVLQSPTTEIQRLNTGNKGGTYLQIKCHKVHVPRSCKREWNCVWATIDGSFTMGQKCCDDSSLGVSSTYQIIRMIFREKPFIFLRDVLRRAVENVILYDRYLFMMTECPQITFNNQIFYDTVAKHKAKPSDEVRRFFAQALAEDYLSGAVLQNNRYFIEKCLHSGNPAVASIVKKFDLTEFYYQKIGDAVDFDRLPWNEMQLTATHFASIAFEALPKKQQNTQSFKILTERFQVN